MPDVKFTIEIGANNKPKFYRGSVIRGSMISFLNLHSLDLIVSFNDGRTLDLPPGRQSHIRTNGSTPKVIGFTARLASDLRQDTPPVDIHMADDGESGESDLLFTFREGARSKIVVSVAKWLTRDTNESVVSVELDNQTDEDVLFAVCRNGVVDNDLLRVDRQSVLGVSLSTPCHRDISLARVELPTPGQPVSPPGQSGGTDQGDLILQP